MATMKSASPTDFTHNTDDFALVKGRRRTAKHTHGLVAVLAALGLSRSIRDGSARAECVSD
jgi:hypothetical protein